MTTATETKPYLNLSGVDGNAFAIIGAAMKAARAGNMPNDFRERVRNEMMSGDYDHLLQVAMNNFDVHFEDEEEDEDFYD